MTAATRLTTAVVLAIAATTGYGLAQGAGQPAAPAPGRGQAPASPDAGRGQAPAPPDAGRGRVGAPAGARRGGFTQFVRPIATQDVIVRGKALYENNCASCHAADLRGTADGKNPNLLRSGVALRDQHGELIGARARTHTPPLTLVQDDIAAVAEYIHSVHATMGGQGSPPGRNPTDVTLNVLVGDARSGEAAFAQRCAACHSVTGNLRGIGSKFSDPRALQNGWVSGSMSVFGRGRGGGGGPVPATVTLADGSKLDGTLLREDDFLVVLQLPDGTRRSMARADGIPKVETKDPKVGHIDAIVKLAHDDTTSKIMHDITAYLWSVK
ncbi:MAG: c-type cytochrome [Acidobacteria bacterium]|nr:c-type cytochrome [Acidobacteriota bacterium]